MLNFLSRAFGLSEENSGSSVESVTHLDGEYFVVKRGESSAAGVNKETAKQQIQEAGGNPNMIDKLP
ncbi:hypothetical protein QUA04_25485 [Microcoleus sp. S13_C5]